MERTPLRIAALAVVSAAVSLAAGPTEAEGPAVARLAEALRFETISHADPADTRREPFVAFRRFVTESFPAVHAQLELEVVAGHSLLYTWRGTGTAATPILITSHYDVVPVPPESLPSWEHPPFGGVVADGFVWGRGALDDKFGVIATLEAVERLLEAGFTPSRTVYLAFGHDEEIGGVVGAKGIADLLESRGVRLAWTLDEGMAVISGVMPGMNVPAALIGVAEKGYVHMEITARAPGGHSSMPPRQGAIGRIARAVTRLEENPMPAHMEIAGQTLDALSPHMEGLPGVALRFRTFLGPIVRRILGRNPPTDALVRTTTAVTIMRAGVKSNVLPSSATATVNFRVLPGDTVEGIEAHVRRVVDDPELEIEIVSGSEASEIATTDSDGYRAIAAAIGEVFPEAAVAPGLVLGGTDSRHYGRVADDSYRFGPLDLAREDTARLHGVNERIAVANYAQAIDFYATLIRGSASP